MTGKNPINIQTATVDELKTIKNVGDKIADRIIEIRESQSEPITLDQILSVGKLNRLQWLEMIEMGDIIGLSLPDPLEAIVLNIESEKSDRSHDNTSMNLILGMLNKIQNKMDRTDSSLHQITSRLANLEGSTPKKPVTVITDQPTLRPIISTNQSLFPQDQCLTSPELSDNIYKLPTGLKNPETKKVDKQALQKSKGKKEGTRTRNRSPEVDSSSDSDTDTESESSSAQRHRRRHRHRHRTSSPVRPKMPTFTGDSKSKWEPFILLFERIAKHQNWSSRKKTERLLDCLRDSA